MAVAPMVAKDHRSLKSSYWMDHEKKNPGQRDQRLRRCSGSLH